MDDYLDSPMDAEDVFPCKGCGEILEEGKAFELAGNRWHLNCFRCNTCGTLLDSDANLLLLGDGSLICNNCTYSCSACGNKIEDLAILTGDQAFCATCFRCRNCKRKIENLRYARTSQGIFCMSCHESLMARRRKKSKAAAQAKAREKDGSPMITDKSLPALPPSAIPPNAFSNDRVSPEDTDTPTELSPRPRTTPAFPTKNEADSRSNSRAALSPEPTSEPPVARDNSHGLAPASYRNNRNSSMFHAPPDLSGGVDGESFFIPVALDPSPMPPTSDKRSKDKDYFAAAGGAVPDHKKSDSQASTPHIGLQGRHPSSDYENIPPKMPSRKLSKSSRAGRDSQVKHTAVTADDHMRKMSTSRTEEFKLQEAPKSKKAMSSRSNSQSGLLIDNGGSGLAQRKNDSPQSNESPQNKLDRTITSRSSPESRYRDEDDPRQSIDSLASSRTEMSSSRAVLRKEPPQSSGHRNVNNLQETPPGPPPRPPLPENKLSDTYMQPRAPPPPPIHATPKEAQTPQRGGDPSSPQPGPSPALPRWSAGGDFSMDEDMARILGTDEGSSSILRRVSNAVRHGRNNSVESSATPNPGRAVGHGRSMSDATRGTASPRWPKTPIAEDPNQAQDISSPISVNGATQDDPAFLKRQLRSSENRIAELERRFSAGDDLVNLNKKLIEKRKTVTVLDTQAEIMVRELEVLAKVVERGKQNGQPVDIRELQETVVKELRQKIEKYTQSMTATIEQLIAERDQLVEEKNRAMADRDRALLEFEQLSSKNAQLADMNNDLTHQIQERFKSQASDLKSPNGLAIYSNQVQKGPSSAMGNFDSSSIQTGATLVTTDVDEPILEGPTVVNIRKGQVKKFNWKKGSKTVAQNLTKGMNRAVGAFQNERERGGQYQGGLTADNIGLPYNMTVAQVELPATPLGPVGPNGPQNRQPSDHNARPFGFFGKKQQQQQQQALSKSMTMSNVSTASLAAEPPNVLFGSDLVERADYERRLIPSVVTRCIEEVELRGMDMEGIYRKTGGNSQVRTLQEGFDKNDEFDISDPGLDITAVTSVLKQYFRKLPTPLLTYDVYERVLESNAIPNEKERCQHLRATFNMLPERHRQCLEFLMFHLARVAAREAENLMPPKNLAVVFAPTIMRDHSLEKDMTDMHAKNLAVQFVIENSTIIFAED
ncbi:hypothetical protein RB595_006437 [Gaeumannomyces hyphopodioides]